MSPRLLVVAAVLALGLTAPPPSLAQNKVPPAGKRVAPPPPEARFGEGESVTWSVFKDQAVEGLNNYVKDELGNIYRVLPGGPQLPFGISREIIEAQKKRYGIRLVPVPDERFARLTENVSATWEVFKLGTEILDVYNGEDEVAEAQNKIIAATVAAEAGLLSGAATASLGLTPAMGLAPALLAGVAGSKVKQAVFEALEAWDAHVQATEAEKEWKENDVRLARQKVQQIRQALEKGEYEDAMELNRDLNAFTEDRRLGISEMGTLNAITWKLQSQIYEAMREEAAQEERDEAARRAEYQRKLDEIHQYWVEDDRRRQEEQALFNVRIVTATNTVEPGQRVPVGIILDGGRPPYTLSGLVSTRLDGEELSTAFEAPAEPDVYDLSVTAVDADGLERSHRLTIQVVAATEPAGSGPVSALPMEPTFDLSGVSVVVIHAPGRKAAAEQIAAFLRASNAQATLRESQGSPASQAQHRGAIYASPAFMSKAHLIARQLQAIEPFSARPFSEVRGPANQLTLWLVGS